MAGENDGTLDASADELDLDATALDDETAGDEPSGDDETDPVAALTEQFAALNRTVAAQAKELQQFRSQQGRDNGAINAALADLRDRDVTAPIKEQIAHVEGVLDDLIENLDDIALKGDGRATIQQRVTAFKQANEARTMRASIVADVKRELGVADDKPATKPADNAGPDGGDDLTPEMVQALTAASLRISAFAEALEVDPTTIPAEVIAFRDGEDIATAEARVKAEIRRIANGEQPNTPAGRVADRKGAAGNGGGKRVNAPTDTKALMEKAASGAEMSGDELTAVATEMAKLGIAI